MRRLLFALYVMALPATADVLQQFVAQDGIAGQFSQNILSPEGVVLDQSSGDFKLLKPHFFWWHITAPDNQLMVAADDRLTQIDWDLEVTVERQLSDSERSPFYWLLAPREALLAAFSLDASDAAVTLTPLDPSAYYQRVQVAQEGPDLWRITLLDQSGQSIDLTLSTLPEVTLAPSDFSVPAVNF
jgi:outer membrane lipoprotein-sorting protein